MTISEAEHILEIVSLALQERSYPRFHPTSALQGHDVFQIDTALKLRIANEFLILSGRQDFDQEFEKSLRSYGNIPLMILSSFVDDEKMARLKDLEPGTLQFQQVIIEIMPTPIDSREMRFKDDRFNELETIESFGNYCRGIGSNDPLFWQKIYTYLGLAYTTASPEGNSPCYF